MNALSESTSLTVEDFPLSTEMRLFLKSSPRMTFSLPGFSAVAGSCARRFKRVWMSGSRPVSQPQSFPLSDSPSSVLHERIATCPTVTLTFAAAGVGGALTAGAVLAGALAAAEAEAISAAREAATALTASAGAAGPRRTPASFGHATPMAKPTRAKAPTRSHEGLSAPGAGICIEGRAAILREIVSMLPFSTRKSGALFRTAQNGGSSSSDPPSVDWN